VLALSLADVRDALNETASQYAIPSDVARLAIEPVDRRIGELSAQPDLELAISDRDRIRIGLVALANRERRIIVDHHAQRTVSGAAIERLLRNTNAECADLFGSLICRREGAEELLLEPDVSPCVNRCKTHRCLSTAPVSRLSDHSSNGNPTYCSANDAWACSEACR
jgi:hypothetical protein